MLSELHVRDLGVIADLSVVFRPGMTALTGETGAGKTLLVEAIELLVGGRADPTLVRPGAPEAVVEGRFVRGEDEVVVTRIVPSGGGRSRAYVDGRMAPVSALADLGAGLVDLHGQHAHQSLLSPAMQRSALDAFAGIDPVPLREARRRVREIDAVLASLGGDARSRAREADLLGFQVREIDAARIQDGSEDERLAEEEERLADVDAARDAAATALEALTGEGGAVDSMSRALSALSGRPALAAVADRLHGLQAELSDAATDLRVESEQLETDPHRLDQVRERRQLLRELRRKYGETLEEVVAFGSRSRERLLELESHEARVAALEQERTAAVDAVSAAATEVARARREAAPRLSDEVARHLHELALPRARLEVSVEGEGPADDVAFLFAANLGDPVLPLAKVASGGELARVMLAARLVLSDAPPVLVFDEVDAGIGGTAAIAVGRSLAALASDHQVLVVTHLPQVAAFADQQVSVEKRDVGGRTVAVAAALDGPERVIELSRMLSGQPDSAAARGHAEELLASAAQARGR